MPEAGSGKLFLFDFDGVLADSLDFYEQMIRACLDRIGQPVVQTREDYLALFDDNFYEGLIRKGVDLAAFAGVVKQRLKGETYEAIRPVPGLGPILAALHGKHILMVISSSGYRTIHTLLHRFGWESYFADIMGSDFHLSKKDKIAHAVKTRGVSPDAALYIGDTAGDIREAKAAGIRAVAAAWGWHSRERLQAAAPDVLLETPADLLTL